MADTKFKKGKPPANFKGIGVPRMKGGKMVVTINEMIPASSRGKAYMTKKTVSLARYVYGLENIPEGFVVVNIDGDCMNNDISNLKAISKRERMRFNMMKKRRVKDELLQQEQGENKLEEEEEI